MPSERHAASGRLGKAAQINGSVKHVNLSPDDLAACAEAKLGLAVEQVALQKLRAFKHGWVCALWVQKQLHVFLAHDLDGVAGLEFAGCDSTYSGYVFYIFLGMCALSA